MNRLMKFYLLIFGIGAILPLQAQNNIWQDGNPTFTQTYADTLNISFEPFNRQTVSLARTDSRWTASDSPRYVLDGITWKWLIDQNKPETILLASEDIEFFNQNGEILYLVVDGSGNKVVVLRQSDNQVILTFEATVGKKLHMSSPSDLDLFMEDGLLKLLISDTGRHRVIQVDFISKTVDWQYGIDDKAGTAKNQLFNPTDAVKVPDLRHFIICDQGNHRILWVNAVDTSIVWEWGQSILNVPVDVNYNPSPANEILVTDQGNNRVLIVDVTSKNIVWELGADTWPASELPLKSPTDADFLKNGNILITDAGNERIIEVTRTTPPRIAWDARKRLSRLREADRIQDKNPEMNDQTLFIDEDANTGFLVPFRLAYQSAIIESDPNDAGKAVNFDSLFFYGLKDAGVTDFKVQMRSSATALDLAVANWYGPFSDTDYYEQSSNRINPIHDGDRWFQFRFFLETNNKLFTPMVADLTTVFHSYSDQIGILKTNLIGSNSGTQITKWRNLEITSTWPAKTAYHNLLVMNINLYSAKADKLAILAITGSGTRQFDLTKITALQGVQQLYLQIELQSYFSAFSPILDDLKITWDGTPTDIQADSGKQPAVFSLAQNYPNPFNGATTISYTLPRPTQTVLKIYDFLGKEVATLVNKFQAAGTYQVQWSGDLPSGIYWYQLQAGEDSASKKMLLLK